MLATVADRIRRISRSPQCRVFQTCGACDGTACGRSRDVALEEERQDWRRRGGAGEWCGEVV